MTEKKLYSYEIIEDILEQFDFKTVHKVMKDLDWEWYNSDGVPTIKELKEAAKEKLYRAYFTCREQNKEEYFVASGGLKATCTRYETDFGNFAYNLSLEFVLKEWSDVINNF